jgi:hypothetical protein
VLLSRREGRPLTTDDGGIAWYKTVIGSCARLASGCRPYIAFAVHYLAHFLNAPTAVHLHAAARLLYLQATRTHGIAFGGPGREAVEDNITIYHDATFAAD